MPGTPAGAAQEFRTRGEQLDAQAGRSEQAPKSLAYAAILTEDDDDGPNLLTVASVAGAIERLSRTW
jgi:hypothetical protein